MALQFMELPLGDERLSFAVYPLLHALRSRGIGTAVFAVLEQRGRAARCERIELDSGVTNDAGHRFYERQRMGATALHFARALDDAE